MMMLRYERQSSCMPLTIASLEMSISGVLCLGPVTDKSGHREMRKEELDPCA